MKHSECSPSQLARVLACPGSRRLLRQREKKQTTYAEEGSMLHAEIEARLTEGNSSGVELTREQNIAIEECIDYYDALIRELKLTTVIKSTHFEQPTNLGWCGLPEVSGYTDVAIISENRVDVIDWKFGKGIPVYAPQNIQGMAYAAGTFINRNNLISTPDIHIHIVQPFLDYYVSWQISGEDLHTWILKEVIPGIQLSRTKNAACIPGEMQCRFCVGVECTARVKDAHVVASTIFDKYAESDFSDPYEVVYLLDKTKQLKAFIAELTSHIMEKCNTPEGFEGFKIVNGRASRKWHDDSDAEQWLIDLADDSGSGFEFDDLYETKFLSVAKAEKLAKGLKKNNDFKALWFKSPGKPVLTTEDDPRESINSSAAEVFKQYAKKD